MTNPTAPAIGGSFTLAQLEAMAERRKPLPTATATTPVPGNDDWRPPLGDDGISPAPGLDAGDLVAQPGPDPDGDTIAG